MKTIISQSSVLWIECEKMSTKVIKTKCFFYICIELNPISI